MEAGPEPVLGHEARRSATREKVVSSVALTATFLAMNAAATVIASLGLLENSAAVIIGAMLIAMLFGPIVGIALALAEGDLPLLGRSLVSEIVGAAGVLGIGYVVGLAAHRLSMGSEILSRTAPNIMDLVIGLVGGMAGGFMYVSPNVPGVVVGVAIATSLAPPLASCGILLAHHLPALAAGAFLLFLANFTAIAIGAMTVFWLSGHRALSAVPARNVLVPRLVSFLLLAVLGVYFTVTFHRAITRSLLENGIRTTLSREVGRIPGARMVDVTFSPARDAILAWVVVRTPQPVTPADVGRLNDVVNAATGASVALHVRSVITSEATRQGYIYAPSPADPGPP
jgi:uncharacterized hydrophobic protein (TIGR00271 family)